MVLQSVCRLADETGLAQVLPQIDHGTMNGTKVVACSGQKLHLECEAGHRIQLISALYGHHHGSNKSSVQEQVTPAAKVQQAMMSRSVYSPRGAFRCCIKQAIRV